jgi:hypothetical protein
MHLKGTLPMPQLAQSPQGETAQERQQRRDALLRYGHIFSEVHRQVSPVRHTDESVEQHQSEKD